ncbi:MAG: phosphatase PAP2 family protein [Candidatus Dojkabacteria bacterium]|jgi:membrane-associated phospholipid phosphatase|nr:phosphatase PAP2 family protein [Candidatus Dojkabacteria bacterium]MDD2270066.1 phosphatase PAP2 family protein [Candidatus Dojkabacteria bacterium]
MKILKKNDGRFLKTLIQLPSILFSAPVVTAVCTIAITKFVDNLGLIVSSVFFYILTPILAYVYLYKKGLITDKGLDFNIRKREERPLYNIIITLGFLTNYILFFIYKVPGADKIALFLLLSFLLFTIVTFFWKISGHMTQTVLCILTLAYVFPDVRIYILLAGYLICVPLVALSRIKLKHHNIWQVIAGTLATSAVGLLVFTIL